MLKDLGVYGPVAQIVRCASRAHRRARLPGPARRATTIPEVARIVAVAEVYDTLTAEDTYRDRMTPFRRSPSCAASPASSSTRSYVEALASLLAGRSLEYRHADAADFDSSSRWSAA